MPAQKTVPNQMKKISANLPTIPGVANVARSVESALPKQAPRISDAIPCRRGK